jgi:hypothetical protein
MPICGANHNQVVMWLPAHAAQQQACAGEHYQRRANRYQRNAQLQQLSQGEDNLAAEIE